MELTENTFKLLDINSAHIPPHTAQALEKGGKERNGLWFELCFEPWNHYGWVLLASEYQAEEAKEFGHLELSKLLSFASERGYNYLKLDCDASPLPKEAGFPTYAW